MNITKTCFQCRKNINENNTTFRYCDATLCSIECKMTRAFTINKIDPNFKNPQLWKNNRDIPNDEKKLYKLPLNHKILKRTKSQIKIDITDNHNIKKQKHQYYEKPQLNNILKIIIIIKKYTYYIHYLAIYLLLNILL